ncbi:MAG: NUDIX hydrolase [Bacteroidetes bacterium]|nr:MAG: NUDIX hydrolase [Bacteroidota bacterium]
MTQAQQSAGGVVLDGHRALLIRTRTRGGRTVWTFPKGRIEPGEERQEAALREVLEETGYACRIHRPLRSTTFHFRHGGQRVAKTVYWFLMEPVRKARHRSLREVDEARWVPLAEAYTKLTYRSDRALLAWVEEERARARQQARPGEPDPPRKPGRRAGIHNAL